MPKSFNNLLPFLFLSIGLLVFSACASTIDRKDDIDKIKLTLGASTKTNVVDAVGLPKVVKKNNRDLTEIWGYTGAVDSTGYIFAAPSGYHQIHHGALVQMSTVNVDAQNNNPIMLYCLFDKDGVLVDFYKPYSDKKTGN